MWQKGSCGHHSWGQTCACASQELGLPRMPGWADSQGSGQTALRRIPKILPCSLKPVITKTEFETGLALLLAFARCSFLRRLNKRVPNYHQGLLPMHAAYKEGFHQWPGCRAVDSSPKLFHDPHFYNTPQLSLYILVRVQRQCLHHLLQAESR